MTLSTICNVLKASPFASSLLSLTMELLPLISQLGQAIRTFQTGPITPAASHAFEIDLERQLLEIGRVILQAVFNRLEPEVRRCTSTTTFIDAGIGRPAVRALVRGSAALPWSGFAMSPAMPTSA